MNRRHFLKTLGVGVAALSLSGCKESSQKTSAGEKSLSGSRPNIILVMTDDQGMGDLSCLGNTVLKTPNLDKLYTQSTRFTDFHVSPTCAPTRSALMSGRAPFKNGVTHTILERERMALSSTTVAQVLKSAGYTTGIFGKWHLGDDDDYQPDRRGFDEVFIHGAGGIGQNYPGTQGAVPGTDYFDPIIKHNNTFVHTEGYCTDVFFQQALSWIKHCKDKPFFAYVSTNAPHGPFNAPDRYAKRFLDQGFPEKLAGFYGMIENIDDNMGLLLGKLKEWGFEENTLLVFMTDNGSTVVHTIKGSPQHRKVIYNAGMKGYKNTPNEGGSRVPLFFRLGGKIKAGVDVDRLTRHYDIFPTLAEFAGAKVPKGYKLDGRSLMPLIDNPKANWKDRYTFFHTGRWNKKDAQGKRGEGNTDPDNAKYKGFAVRSEKWRLVGKNELYNIDADPGEKNNVIADHPQIAQKMLKAYDAWWDEVRPMMVNEDASLDTGKPFIKQYEKQKKEKGIGQWNNPLYE